MTAPTPTLAPRSSSGLFRTAACGQAATLTQTFHELRQRLGLEPLHGNYGGWLGTGDGDDRWELVSLHDEIFVVLADCHYRAERSEWVLSESFVELHFSLVGSARASWARNPATDARKHELVLCHLGPQARYRISCAPGRRRSLAIYVRPQAFEAFLDPHSPAGSAVLKDLHSVNATEVYFRRVAASPLFNTTLTQLLATPYTDRRRLRYVRAKVEELLCATVDLWQAPDIAGDKAVVLAPRDLARLHEARRLLVDTLAEPLTIPLLARAVGINSSKLKAGFRLLYGSTIHEYVLHARMQRAQQLLAQGLPVNEVAQQVGYQHASSFSAAFTRHHGYPPTQRRWAVAASVSEPGLQLIED